MAGSVVLSTYSVGNIRKIVATCIGDAANGSFPATVLPSFEGRLLDLMTIEGTNKPTNLWDLTLVTADGFDVLQGVGIDRATATAQKVPIVYSGTGTHPTVDESDVLTLTIANNSVNSANIVIHLYYALGG